MRTLVLPEAASGRLDSVLSGLLPEVSRRRLKDAFREGRVRVDGRRVRGSDLARPGSTVELSGLDDADTPAPAPEVELAVVYEDDDLLVVDKPAGVPVAPHDPAETGTLAGAVLARYPDLVGVGDLPLAPGLCHRLDMGTSGLVLFARRAEVFEAIRDAFEARAVEKVYHAVVTGELLDTGTIDEPISRVGRGRKMHVGDTAHARTTWPAVTRWTVLDRTDARTLLEVVIETGVTHQIRAHLAWYGRPVVGDTLYGGEAAPRLALHAAKLAFEHPATGSRLEVESPTTGHLRSLLT